MSFPAFIRAAVLAALVSVITLPAGAQSLTTTFAAGNAQNGNIFDVTPNANLTINSFDINYSSASASPNGTIQVYWRTGTSSGAQNSAAGWVLLGTASVTSQGQGKPTPVPIGGLALAGGQTYGIYIHFVENNNNLAYTGGGPTIFANADLSLTTRFGKENGVPLMSGETFSPRQWNGTVHYTLAASVTCASEGYTGTKLTWCVKICESGISGRELDTWIQRWTTQFRKLPYCAAAGGGLPPV